MDEYIRKCSLKLNKSSYGAKLLEKECRIPLSEGKGNKLDLPRGSWHRFQHEEIADSVTDTLLLKK